MKTADGIVECKARGRFRKEGVTPMVGDSVEVSVKNGKGSLDEIYPRTSMLVRPAVANINQLAVVAALRSPDPHAALIDSFLILGEYSGIETILCFNKADLPHSQELVEVYRKAGYRVVLTSVENGEGVDELKGLLQGKITAFAGNSGVGKSSLLNALGAPQGLETGEVSEKIQRGRHTTRHVELIELDGGALVLDTPGFSSFEMPAVKADELQDYFIEFAPYIGRCRFRGCAHIQEPGCAVLQAVEDGAVSKMRHDSYVAMYQERKKVKDWEV